MLGIIGGALALIKGMTSDGTVRKAVDTVSNYLGKDERILDAANKQIDSARKHDTSITATAGVYIKALHSSVRPVITYVAFAYFIYAKLNDIVISDYDYAIIGGIIAFWFGFRPFEKRLKN